jgi:CTP:molybdopterin cytidylyltransferase MocA
MFKEHKTKDLRPKANKVAAIVLAAGRSKRMGAFKPLLPFGDKTVIDHCIDNLREAGIDSIVVVLGHRRGRLTRHLQNANVGFAVNPDPTSEMTASIALGIRHLPQTAKAVIIMPADHPAIPASVVAILISEWRKGARLVMPTWNKRGGHPVLIDLRLRADLLRLDPRRGLKALFDGCQDQVKRVSVDSPYIARDMDTWDDYCALHQEIFGVSPSEQVRSEQVEADERL